MEINFFLLQIADLLKIRFGFFKSKRDIFTDMLGSKVLPGRVFNKR